MFAFVFHFAVKSAKQRGSKGAEQAADAAPHPATPPTATPTTAAPSATDSETPAPPIPPESVAEASSPKPVSLLTERQPTRDSTTSELYHYVDTSKLSEVVVLQAPEEVPASQGVAVEAPPSEEMGVAAE